MAADKPEGLLQLPLLAVNEEDVLDSVPPNLIDVQSAAEKHYLKPATIRAWIRKGYLKVRGRVRRGRGGPPAQLVLEAELEAYMGATRNKGGRPRKSRR